ncbi:MAG: anti-sigma factor RsbA family regulatory protein [Solirubrobacterales bacterium]
MNSDGAAAFHHEALFYGGEDEFLAGALPFIEEGLAAGEPVLVAVGGAKIRLLESRLDGATDRVRFTDMAEIGRNPACLIPVWREFVDNQALGGRPVRGIGEPVWAERSPAELVECEHHESLVNVAFSDAPAWRLLCSYDTEELEASVIDAARRSHPFILDRGRVRRSDAYLAPEEGAGPFEGRLPARPREAEGLDFARNDLNDVRSHTYRIARRAGLDPERTANAVLAVSEVATNSVRHAGGHGELRSWTDDGALLFEVRDEGRIDTPLVGRERPELSELDGRGLWVVNQLCDLVQIRSSSAGNVIRLHTRLE